MGMTSLCLADKVQPLVYASFAGRVNRLAFLILIGSIERALSGACRANFTEYPHMRIPVWQVTTAPWVFRSGDSIHSSFLHTERVAPGRHIPSPAH